MKVLGGFEFSKSSAAEEKFVAKRDADEEMAEFGRAVYEQVDQAVEQDPSEDTQTNILDYKPTIIN